MEITRGVGAATGAMVRPRMRRALPLLCLLLAAAGCGGRGSTIASRPNLGAKGTDTQAIKSAIEQLEAASHAFSKTLYEKGGAGQPAGTSNDIDTGPAAGAGSHTTQTKPDEDVIEGEFEVKK